ncbi:unnamed protein product [Enterobius vermicularis]|uniref:protein-tyrosine-phosphatase n=1 Tax=Enterobius vermicularis TaxID=51028 RepID=A0A0N4VBL8_ENTVE|nr:unnamed protein product [Enterobius vermicularis]
MLLRVLSSTSSSSSNSSQPQDEKEGDESPPSLNSILMTSDEDREIETQKEKDADELNEDIKRLSLENEASGSSDARSSDEASQAAGPSCPSLSAIDTTPVSAHRVRRKRKRFRSITNCQSPSSPASKVRVPANRRCLSRMKAVDQRLSNNGRPPPLTPRLKMTGCLKALETPQIPSTAFQSICGEELARLMRSISEESLTESFIIIDCRYPYEYNAGHVKTAINVYEPRRLKDIFYPKDEELFNKAVARVPIFYCEYSQKRGPSAAEFLRNMDRSRNEYRYPELDYKEIYVLDGGYKKLFEDGRFIDLCDPPGYVRMYAKRFRKSLAKYHVHKPKICSRVLLTSRDRFDISLRRARKLLRKSLQSPSRFPSKQRSSSVTSDGEPCTPKKKLPGRLQFTSPS